MYQIFPEKVQDFPAQEGYAVFLQFHVLNLCACMAWNVVTMTSNIREEENPEE